MSVLLEPSGIENKLIALEKKISAAIAELANIKRRLAALERGKRGVQSSNRGFHAPAGDGEVQELDDQGCAVS